MPTSLALLLLAGLVIFLLVIMPALAMAGHQSDLDRQAEIIAATERATQSADKDPDNAD